MDARALTAALFVGAIVLCSTHSAAARFGSSHGAGGHSGGGHSGAGRSGAGRSSGGFGGSRNRATVYTSRSASTGSPVSNAPYRGPGPGPGPWPVWNGYYRYGFVSPLFVAPTFVAGSRDDWVEDEQAPPTYVAEPTVMLTASGELTLVAPATMLGVQAAVEGPRLGFQLAYTNLSAPYDEWGHNDVYHFVQSHLTYALYASDRGRLRAEFGAHVAVAPDVTFVAPGVGVSTEFGLVGPFGIEARLYANVWPFTQLDARGGLTIGGSHLVVRIGARVLYVDDNGVLGAANAGATSDLYYGPYLSLGVAL